MSILKNYKNAIVVTYVDIFVDKHVVFLYSVYNGIYKIRGGNIMWSKSLTKLAILVFLAVAVSSCNSSRKILDEVATGNNNNQSTGNNDNGINNNNTPIDEEPVEASIASPTIEELELSLQSINDCMAAGTAASEALGTMRDMLTRIRELCMNAPYYPEARADLQAEIDALKSESVYVLSLSSVGETELFTGNSASLTYSIMGQSFQCINTQTINFSDVITTMGDGNSFSVATDPDAGTCVTATDVLIPRFNDAATYAGVATTIDGQMNLVSIVKDIVSAQAGTALCQNVRQIVSSSVSEVASTLQRMRELAQQAAMGIFSPEELLALDTEFQKRYESLANMAGVISTIKDSRSDDLHTLVSGESYYKDECFMGSIFDLTATGLLINGLSLTTVENATAANDQMLLGIAALSEPQIHLAVIDYAVSGETLPVGMEVYNILSSQRSNAVQKTASAFQDLLSMSQTEQGYVQGIQEAFSRMHEIAVQASNGILTPQDRANIDTEFRGLLASIRDIELTTKFNGRKLFNPTDGGYLITMKPGAETFTYNSNAYNFALATEGLESLDLTTEAGAAAAVTVLNARIAIMNDELVKQADQATVLETMSQAVGNTCWLSVDQWAQLGISDTPCNITVTSAPSYTDMSFDDSLIKHLLPEIDRVALTYSEDFTTTALGIANLDMLNLAGIVNVVNKISPTLSPAYLYMVEGMTAYEKCSYGYFAPGEGWEICAGL